MSCATRRIILILGTLVSMLRSYQAIADYGQSCATLPTSGITEEFIANSAYGYLRDNFNMGNCTQQPKESDQIQFCILGEAANQCDLVTMREDETRTVAELSQNPKIGGNPFIGIIPLTTKRINGKLCVTMVTSRGEQPIICRSIQTDDTKTTTANTNQETYSNLPPVCYQRSKDTKSLLGFSGGAVECITKSLQQLFAEKSDQTLSVIQPFTRFQDATRTSIRIAFVLYIIFFGLKLLLQPDEASATQVITAVLKLILVAYFSVGIGPLYYKDGGFRRQNGVTEFLLPILNGMQSGFVQTVFDAGSSRGLCHYAPELYPADKQFYSWNDSLECRLMYLLGIKFVQDASELVKGLSHTTDNLGYANNLPAKFESNNENTPEFAKNDFNPGTFALLFGAFLTGEIMIVICGLITIIMFLSITFYAFTVYIVCTITLSVLAYISPIFIPMVLFKRTKHYFDSWVRVLLSVTLQPMVVFVFLGLAMVMYTNIVYPGCEFKKHDYQIGGYNISTFELRVPAMQPEVCIASPGYQVMKYIMGNSWGKRTAFIFELPIIQNTAELAKGMASLSIFMLILYYVAGYITTFAAELTSGPNLAAVVASPTQIADAIMKRLNPAKSNKNQNGAQKGSGDLSSSARKTPGSSDTSSAGRQNQSSDSFSGGSKGGTSGDSFNVGTKK